MREKHRIFIAINLPEKIKEKLISYQRQWQELPVKWTKKDNLHITLFFLGHVDNDEVLKIINILKEEVLKFEPFFLKLKKISYVPTRNNPKMIWAIGENSEKLIALKNDIEKALIEKTDFSPEKRKFSFHITLGRIKQWEFRRIEPEEVPEIDEEINLNFEVKSIELMESKLKRSGPQYIMLESFKLEKKN
ncbi:MAG TPA: RNA 2',3'-cyclic phosphodiesterase [Candidatus Pacearchaeota archaeon]|nr:RNA 2',3'-cyclic phosphodiesterase [Candidatus Pacearchaeota archaeon]HOL90444.1 RNA 2',3'-cyclic phosphodiesterase [Candidatus Pacearchaeota archaeon]HOW13013.1 RNA 2',3'-cyclic phosphodiesterase [Candidatus Pacearchaeota archaeon]HPO68431.1 RNA 2',3'-cyclic phosphodiesterase [Candidatus Pacearchaeota archaeon]